uniref:Transmembrane protein n=1 Tax=Chromera velia CCMP2878 TaxID=1169474 RepID=A0A0G4FI78_9ALVE|eukprot:Cvel_3354.t1-p1 / transcript=Cvel_3354.t1 / gene=Cvel_3354 / organism=Chromera_velia_CCMP2878 / gene_product=hypothetical protein / transcript_product=hypothetical protein / location=Cvel_scaffold134:7188-13286(-) / protein_length=831 / sequence_SO=supercontig / SO=protein_coding / is_pseudo=false
MKAPSLPKALHQAPPRPAVCDLDDSEIESGVARDQDGCNDSHFEEGGSNFKENPTPLAATFAERAAQAAIFVPNLEREAEENPGASNHGDEDEGSVHRGNLSPMHGGQEDYPPQSPDQLSPLSLWLWRLWMILLNSFIVVSLAIPLVLVAIGIAYLYRAMNFMPSSCAEGSRTTILAISAPLASAWLICQYWLFVGHQGYWKAFEVVGWPLALILAFNWILQATVASLDFDSARFFVHVALLAVTVELGVVVKNVRKVSFYDRKVKTIIAENMLSEEEVQKLLDQAAEEMSGGSCPFACKAAQLALPLPHEDQRQLRKKRRSTAGAGEKGAMKGKHTAEKQEKEGKKKKEKIQSHSQDSAALSHPLSCPCEIHRKTLQGNILKSFEKGQKSDLVPTLRKCNRGGPSRPPKHTHADGEEKGKRDQRALHAITPDDEDDDDEEANRAAASIGRFQESVFLKPRAAASLEFVAGYSGLTNGVRLLKSLLYPNGCVVYTVLCLVLPSLVGLFPGEGGAAWDAFIYLVVLTQYLVGQVMVQRVLIETEPRYTVQMVMVLMFAYRAIMESSLLVTSARTGLLAMKLIDELIWVIDVCIVLGGIWVEGKKQKKKREILVSSFAPSSFAPSVAGRDGPRLSLQSRLSGPQAGVIAPSSSHNPWAIDHLVVAPSPAPVEPERFVSPTSTHQRRRKSSIVSMAHSAVSEAHAGLSAETKATFNVMLLGVIVLKTILVWGISVMVFLLKEDLPEKSILDLGQGKVTTKPTLADSFAISVPIWLVAVTSITAFCSFLGIMNVNWYVRETLTIFVQWVSALPSHPISSSLSLNAGGDPCIHLAV